jgi:hypothetical protein
MGGAYPCGAQKDWNHIGKEKKRMNSFLLASRVVSLFITFLMDIVDIIKLLLILKIKKRLHLHVHLVHMHIGECPLVSVMHPQLFKDA